MAISKRTITDKITTTNFILDNTDIAILRVLQKNARATVREIAEEVNLSATPVHERIKKLEREGVIRQYTILIDPAKVNKSLKVICYVSLKEHNKSIGTKFIKLINECNEVLECHNISGNFDFMLKIAVQNMDEYYHFHVHKLSQSELIANVQSMFVMGTIKETNVIV
ncbi:MAG: Lrp/AsnC family transcriptional regulator [Bacteroidota bacterium]